MGAMCDAPRILLASASPRRKALLAAAGFDVDVEAVDVDEAPREAEPPEAYVARVAHAKALASARQHPDRVVLAADTTVTIDGVILGKPSDDDDAARMLRRLSGRTHDVFTAVVVARRDICLRHLERTAVTMRALSAEEIAWYVASGEPRDKAGAYAIQGLASRFVTRIDGSYTNVVGLPVPAIVDLLRRVVAE
jgi:septum formation protein